jgi:hypothetical protein
MICCYDGDLVYEEGMDEEFHYQFAAKFDGKFDDHESEVAFDKKFDEFMLNYCR